MTKVKTKLEFPWRVHKTDDNRLSIITGNNETVCSTYYSRTAEDRFNYIVRLVTHDRVNKSLNIVKARNIG